MTVGEMHISVNLGVQKIASFQVDNLLPQEIDHELNAAMDRFIKRRYVPEGNKYRRGFEQSQKRIDDLRNLVVDRALPAFFLSDSLGDTPTFGDNFFVERSALPTDYLFLVNVVASTRHNCGQVIQTGVNTTEKTFVQIKLTSPITGYKLVAVNVNLYDGEPDQTIISNEDGITYDDLIDSGNYTDGIPSVSIEDQSTFGPTSEESPTADSNELFVSFGDQYNGTFQVTTVWENLSTGEQTTEVNTFTQVVTYQTRTTTASTRSKDVCKYAQHDDLYFMLNDPFNTTKYDYPIYTLQENFVDIYTNNTFVIERIYVKYIRRPNRINKATGSGCELPEHTHQEIVDMAIKSILEGISDPRYNTQSREVAENE